MHVNESCPQAPRLPLPAKGRIGQRDGMSASDPSIYRRPGLLAAGYTDRELRRLRAGGELSRVRPGAYVAGPLPEHDDERHRIQVRAAKGELAGDAVVSHTSAAVMHGLPVWPTTPSRVRLTRARSSGGRQHPLVHLCTAPLSPGEIVEVDGLAVTSVARTIVDLARSTSFESAVVAVDAALARAMATEEEMAEALARAKGWPGAPRARRAVSFADGRSESVGESRSRVAIARAGLPGPALQWEIRAGDGGLIARTDFCWRESRLVGEFDGQVKYGRLLAPGQSAGDAIYQEKLREDRVRAENYSMVRWGWADLRQFGPIAARLRRHLTP